MNDENKSNLTIVGHLGEIDDKDPNGKWINFTLIFQQTGQYESEKYKTRWKTYGKYKDILLSLPAGAKIECEGSLNVYSWTDKVSQEMRVSSCWFLQRLHYDKVDSNGQYDAPQKEFKQPKPKPKPQPQEGSAHSTYQSEDDGFATDNGSKDDVPF